MNPPPTKLSHDENDNEAAEDSKEGSLNLKSEDCESWPCCVQNSQAEMLVQLVQLSLPRDSALCSTVCKLLTLYQNP